MVIAAAATAAWAVALMSIGDNMGVMGAQVQKQGKIVGGSVALGSDYPWIVSLQFISESLDFSHHFCTGSVLNGNKDGKSYFLSAAHCFNGWEKTLEDLNMQSGANDFVIRAHVARDDKDDSGETGYEDVQITAVYCHPDYDDKLLSNDVCVVRSDETVSAEAITLQTTPDCCEADDSLRAIGYGNDADGESTDTLEYLDLAYVPFDECRTTNEHNIIDGMLCGDIDNAGICQGDSGGPLIKGTDKDGIQVGIASFGFDCASDGRTDVWADVGYYYQWIIDAMNDPDFADDSGVVFETEARDCNYAMIARYPWAVEECFTSDNISYIIKCENDRLVASDYASTDCSGDIVGNPYDVTEFASAYQCNATEACPSIPFKITEYSDDECTEVESVDIRYYVSGCVPASSYESEYTECNDGNYKYALFYESGDCNGKADLVTEVDKERCSDIIYNGRLICGEAAISDSPPTSIWTTAVLLSVFYSLFALIRYV